MLSSITSRGQQRDRDVLLRALVEAEIDGAALANQVTALKETVDGIAKVNTAPVQNFYCAVGPHNNLYRHYEKFRIVI